MAYKAKINNLVYDIKDRFTIKEELNETLDSGVIQFSTFNGEVEVESFDNVEIFDTDNKIEKKYLLIDSIDDDIYSFNNVFDADNHNYTFSLFSETKELERIPMPNFSITQPMLETESKKTVWEEIERVCSLYVPRIKIYDANETNRYKYVRKFAIDPLVRTKFENVICPEFQWNNPTLREVLNDLMSTEDCIVILKQGVISFYDLKERGSNIDVSKLSLSRKTISSQDYVGELMIDMQNALGKNVSKTCEYLTLKAPEGQATITTENAVIKTQHPIYAIKKVLCVYYYQYRDDDNNVRNGIASIDITDRVIEEDEWNILSSVKVGGSAYSALDTFTDSNGLETARHKVNFLYFKRGTNEICNFAKAYSFVSGGSKNFAGEVVVYTTNKGIDNDVREAMFYVEYETLNEHSMKVGKYLPAKHPENRMFDNQSNSYVDIEHQSIFEYAKVNRLGNRIREIYGEYSAESDIPKLGDFIGDEILFSREITYFDEIMLFKGYLIPHYILKDFFTGVRAKKRSWQIAKNEDALTRHDVYKVYIEASFQRKIDTFDYSDGDGILNLYVENALYLCTYFVPSFGTYFHNLVSQTEDKNGNFYPSSTSGIILENDIEVQGYSVCLNIGFTDNYKSADYTVKEDSDYSQSFYKYADYNGEMESHKIIMSTKSLSKPSGTGYTEEEQNAFLEKCFKRPKIDLSELGTYPEIVLGLNVKKDNREIIQHTIQFEYCSDTSNIILKRNFLKRIRMLDRSGENFEYFGKIYLSESPYSMEEDAPKGTYNSDLYLKLENVSATSIYYYIKSRTSNTFFDIPSNIKSVCVTDEYNKVMLAFNVPANQNRPLIYFNMLRSRDTKIYQNYYGNKVISDITQNGINNADENYQNSQVETESEVRILRRQVSRTNLISNSDE